MRCANNHTLSQEIKIGEVKVDRCSECGGLWFDRDELRLAKDSHDEYTQWFDIDLWDSEENFRIKESPRLCPTCSVPLYNTEYGNSVVRIDMCRKCQGIWLDRDEFKNILEFIQGKSADNLLHDYMRTLLQEGKEIFTGPESLKSEINDFLIVLKLIQFKLVYGNPALTTVIMNLPFTR